tara:strand:+ start:20329 stop:21126 length:798 start_codon:yes stop_codon:yes gene_type:complete
MNKEKFKVPSGITISIREMNGEDEIALSEKQTIEAGNQLNIFISRVVIGTDVDLTTDEHPNKTLYTEEDIALWPLADKYYVALRARILSLGAMMVFNYRFKSESHPNPKGAEYREDLSKFVGDLDNWDNLTQEEKDNIDPVAVRPYPQGSKMEFEFETRSGKNIQWSLLSSYGEKKILRKLDSGVNKNDDFISRKLKIDRGEGNYQLIENFREFTSRELSELRAQFEMYDTAFTMPVEVTSESSGEIDILPAVALEEFFFPTTII